jgi:hypothetical protein
VGEADLGVLHLALAGFAAQLGDALVDHPHAAGADRVAERFETAARVDRDVTAEGGAPFVNELAALALGAEAEVFDVGELGPGEAVVHLGEVDVLRRDAGHRVCLPGRLLGGAEAEVVEGRVEVRAPGGDRQSEALHQHRPIGEAVRQVGPADDRGGGAVGGRAAVEETERRGDHRRAQHLVLGDLHAQVRLGVARAVVVVLHRDLGERLAADAEGVHVAVGGQREEAGRRVALRQQGVAEARQAAAAAVLELLGAEHQDDVVGAGGDRQTGVAEGVGAGGAVVLDSRDRAVVEAQRVAEGDRGLAARGARHVRAQVGGLDLLRVDLRVGVGLEGRLADEILVAEVVEIAEIGAADADYRDLVPHFIILKIFHHSRDGP